jgi:thiamine biosynthesis lipoprotein ApbE
MVASDHWETTSGWCEVLTERADDLALVSEIARERFAALERACSPHLPEAELTTIGDGTPHWVSPLLAEAVAVALRAAQFSEGRLALAVEGSQPAEVAGTSRPPASADIELDEPNRTLLLPASLQLDLWPTARAWIADRIAEECHTQLGIGTLVNLGGDIAVRGELPPGGWRIRIDDGQPSPSGSGTITMGWTGGLASVTTQSPHWPAEGGTASAPRHWRSVTVAAHSCERAKAACLTALALADSAPRWLTQRELPARLVHIGGVAVQTPGWPT